MLWKRIIWDIVCLILVFVAPWWVTLIVGILGAVFFQWFVELIILGALYDSLFGGVGIPWYRHLIHTTLFTVPVLIIEAIRSSIDV